MWESTPIRDKKPHSNKRTSQDLAQKIATIFAQTRNINGTQQMTEYVNVRASETLDQGELVAFLKSRFPEKTKLVGRTVVKGTECVEVRVPSDSPEFEEIREFIDARRKRL